MTHRSQVAPDATHRGWPPPRTFLVVAASVLVLLGTSSAEAKAAGEGRLGQAAPPQAATRQPAAVASAVDYRPPLAAAPRVVDAFDPPADAYAAGHRGVDLALAQGLPVLAAGSGTVVFAGSVAGRPLLVIAHPDGVRTEYEPVRPVVRAGQQVVGGQVIGQLRGAHANCGQVSCLHWGARRGEEYIDPMGLLERLGVVRLIQ